jgi:DNA cross-link repair 1A protein
MPGSGGALFNGVKDDAWGEESRTKRRRLSDDVESWVDATEESPLGNTLEVDPAGAMTNDSYVKKHVGSSSRAVQKRKGPFLEDSESDTEENSALNGPTEETRNETNITNNSENNDREEAVDDGAFEDFGDVEDAGEDESDQEEDAQERRWMERQRAVELEQAALEYLSSQNSDAKDILCPICNLQLNGLSEDDSSIHVNKCLDGTASPVKQPPIPAATNSNGNGASAFARPAKPAQKDPFAAAAPSLSDSAFTKLMAGKAEDSAWATAAAAETAARGRPSHERTCPFYKIVPGFALCVDAFRYGAVDGCRAYFLSHFHSDHYVGLTSSWSHGPIYCSRVTANLVREQLRVDARWVVELEFEREAEVESAPGVVVTMIPANHCPGSAMFLFEKVVSGQGGARRLQRVLHCGDFRASREMITHPLLRPDPVDQTTGKKRQQRIDTCYLDTTYLNPKYAFPSQSSVMQACADLCVSLDASPPDDMLRHSAVAQNGSAISQFLHPPPTAAQQPSPAATSLPPPRLLVVVGTYSIGKERLCVALAHALKSKIYAPPAKQRICACLEDPELAALLTSDPRAAQVHMAPLFELRAETLAAYLDAQQTPPAAQTQTTLDAGDAATGFGRFTHAVALRPTGWTYRAPRHSAAGGPRAATAPTLAAVLHGPAWKSPFSAADLTPQRGSTPRAAIYGVPYSEHSSFRELCAFACALRINRVVPTVNVGSAKTRERMRWWVERWAEEKRKSGLLSVDDF